VYEYIPGQGMYRKFAESSQGTAYNEIDFLYESNGNLYVGYQDDSFH
jgi:hypothetical protein